MQSVVGKFRPLIINPKLQHKCSIIFLHGSGDTGHGLKQWVDMVLGKDFIFDHIKVIYPTAPLRSYTPMNGALSNVWFDRKQISPFVPEDLESIDPMCKDIEVLIHEENKVGVPKENIIVGGFSMGGSLALHVGYSYCTGLKGIFALSSFLHKESAVYEAIRSQKFSSFPPLFQVHGTADTVVDFKWGDETANCFNKLGINATFRKYENMYHELKKDEILTLQEWILQQLPV